MIRLVCVSFFVISLMFAFTSHAKIDPETIVGMWLFEEGSGNDAEDASENGNDGELMNDPEYVNDGKFGKALSFENSYIQVPSSDSLDSCVESYTGLMWVKLDKKPGVILGGCCNDDHALLNFSYTCLMNVFGPGRGPGSQGKVEVGSGQINPNWVSGAALVNDSQWHHIAFTYDGEEKRIYIDGVVDAQQATTGGFGLMGQPLKIGGMPGERPALGLIDEVAVFNVALEENDVNDIMDHGLERAAGGVAVSSAGNLATTWASVKK